MKHMGIAQFKHEMITMEHGQEFYLNSINLTVKAVEKLRALIKAGVVTPVESEVVKVYKDVDAVMSGDVIIPQMTYIKA